jgi:cyanophycin synthetase
MLLQACGVPVPEGQIVASAAEAWEAAQDIGLPVVVKPSDGNHGRGVALDLRQQADIEAAFALADSHGSEVIVERCIRATSTACWWWAARWWPRPAASAWITGDGKSTVVQLIDSQINADPRRGTTEDHPLNRLSVDEDEVIRLDLQRQGFAPPTCRRPAAGCWSSATATWPSTAPTRSTPRWPMWSAWPPAPWAWTSPAWTWSARTSAGRWPSRAAPSSRSTPAPAC